MGTADQSPTIADERIETTVEKTNLNSLIKQALVDEFDSVGDIEAADPGTLRTRLKSQLADSDANPPLDPAEFPWLTSGTAELLDRIDVTHLYDLAELDTDEIPDEDDFDRAKGQIRTAIQKANNEALFVSEDRTEEVKEQLRLALPSGPQIARRRLTQLEEAESLVGAVKRLDNESLHRESPPTAFETDTDDRPEYRDETQFLTNTDDETRESVATGFQVLSDDDYDNIPTPGEDLPVDGDGNAVAPAPATEPNKQMQVLEYMAKKLGRSQPVMAIGDRGVGKDFRFKYLAWATNRGHRLIDCSSGTKAEHLFGTLSPNEDGVVVVRDGPLKRGLLNPDIVVLSEFTALSPDAMLKLHGLLQEGQVLIEYQNELVKPHPASRVVGTGNPGDKLEYRGAEEPNTATKARFRPVRVPAPDDKDAEIASLEAQLASEEAVVSSLVLRKVVEFARKSRRETNESWPTLSPRNVKHICIDIADGVSPYGAIKSEVTYLANQHMEVDDAVEALGKSFSQ